MKLGYAIALALLCTLVVHTSCVVPLPNGPYWSADFDFANAVDAKIVNTAAPLLGATCTGAQVA